MAAGEKQIQNFQMKSSIPVLRMFDESAAKAFYVDYLGYNIDWEHRFNEDSSSPLYMQVSQGDSIIHLNGHATEETPAAEVRIPVAGLDEYCEYLRAKDDTHSKPSVVDPRYEGRNTDMNIYDPFENYLVFWSPRE